jgi:hypothetical protein
LEASSQIRSSSGEGLTTLVARPTADFFSFDEVFLSLEEVAEVVVVVVVAVVVVGSRSIELSSE